MYKPAMQDAGVTGEPVQENNNELTGQAAQLPPVPSLDRKPLKQKASADAFRALAARLNGAAVTTPDAPSAPPAHLQEAAPVVPELAVQAPPDFIAEQPAPVDLEFASTPPVQPEFPIDAISEQPVFEQSLELQPYTEQTPEQADQGAEIADKLGTMFSIQDIEPELQNSGEAELPEVSPAVTDGSDDSQPDLGLPDEGPGHGQSDYALDEESYPRADLHDVVSTDQAAEQPLPESIPDQFVQITDIAEENQLGIALEPIQPALEEQPGAPAVSTAQNTDHLEPESQDTEITFSQEVPAVPIIQPRQSNEIASGQDEQSIENDDDFELTFATSVAPPIPDEQITSAPATSVESEPIDLSGQEQQHPAEFDGTIAIDEPIDTAPEEASSAHVESPTVQHVLVEEEMEQSGQAVETEPVIEPEQGLDDIPPLDASAVGDEGESPSAPIDAASFPSETIIEMDVEEEDKRKPAAEQSETRADPVELAENSHSADEDVSPELEIVEQQLEQQESKQSASAPPPPTADLPPRNESDNDEPISAQLEDAPDDENELLEENQDVPYPSQEPVTSEIDLTEEAVSQHFRLECEVDTVASNVGECKSPPNADDVDRFENDPVPNEDARPSDIMSSITEKFSEHPELSAKTPKSSSVSHDVTDKGSGVQESNIDTEFDESDVDPQAGETARMLLDIMSKPSGAAQPQERALAADTLLRLVTKIPAKNLIGLSERICIMEKPPALLVNKLIRHPDARVGGPLLEACTTISDQVLLPVIKQGDAEKQRMIARRRELTPALCDALLEYGDPSVFLTIVRNPGASISHSAFNLLNELAKSQPSLQAPLVTRGDTPAPTAFELFWFLP